MEKIGYSPAMSTDSGSGSDQSLEDLLTKSADSHINQLEVLIREHIQNSRDAFSKREKAPEKLIFKVSRKKIDFEFAKLNELQKCFDDCIMYKEKQIDEEYQSQNNPLVKLKETLKDLKKRKNDIFWATIIEDNGCGLDGVSRKPSTEKKTGKIIILDEGDSNKYSNEGGAFGVGKLSAFANNDLSTVFYITSNNGSKHLIGKTKLESYVRKEGKKTQQCGPNIFFGKIESDENGNVISDWYQPKKRSLRSIEGDGLTTIIPSLKSPEDYQWGLQVCYATIHSYFRLFEENSIEVVVEDDLTNDIIKINNATYQEIYIKCEELGYLNDEKFLQDKYSYHLVRPFVLGKQHYSSYKTKEVTFKITNGYKGTAIIHLYQNKFLEKIIEELDSKNKKSDNMKTFRFIRKGMLLRSELLPKRKIFDPLFCGFIEFMLEDGDKLNEILRYGETKSHDMLDYQRYNENRNSDFPSAGTLQQRLFSPLNSEIRHFVDEESNMSVKEGEEYEIKFDFLKGFNPNNLRPSFDRNILNNEYFEKLKQQKRSGIINGKSENSKGIYDDQVTDKNEGLDGITLDSGVLGGKIKKGKGSNEIEKPSKVDSGNQAGKRQQSLSPINQMTKILNKKGRLHEYEIKLSDLPDIVNFEISQDSFITRSILSFDIKKIEINNKEYFDYQPKKIDGNRTIGFNFSNIKSEDGNLLLKLSVHEPSKTESKFNILLS